MPVYFENISHEIRNIIKTSKMEIIICVAWIDFDIYYQCLIDALHRGVKIKILITNGKKVAQYKEYIYGLRRAGAEVDVISLGKAINCMHNKFAIIDQRILISGSYNWTHNAEINFENVTIENKSREEVMDYLYEVERISQMNAIGISKLVKKELCPLCKSFMLNVIIYDEYSMGHLVQICSNDTGHYINLGETVDSLLLCGLSSLYDEECELQESNTTSYEDNMRHVEKEYEIRRKKYIDEYIWSLGFPVHAVGIVTISNDYFTIGEKIIKMIWFNKTCASHFEKVYNEPFDLF